MLGNKKSKIRFFIFLTGLFLFLNSCGLDTFVVVEPPYSIGVGPNVDTEDYSYKFFQFDTNCDLSGYPDDFVFLGTNVYYKIYTNSNDLIAQTSALNALSEDFETSANVASKLIYDNEYLYQPLQVMNYPKQAALVPATDIVNQNVYIRLTDYQDIPNLESRITLSGKPLYNSSTRTIPVRNVGNYTFNFGRTGDFDKVPEIGDVDVCGSSVPSDGIWYVALYAVAFGRKVTFEEDYSNIVYLGAIAINANSPDN